MNRFEARRHGAWREWQLSCAGCWRLWWIHERRCGPDRLQGASPSEDYDAEANVQALFEGTNSSPPTDSPPPPTGLNVWAISADQALPFAVTMTDAMQDAADALGWDLTIFDAKSDPCPGQ